MRYNQNCLQIALDLQHQISRKPVVHITDDERQDLPNSFCLKKSITKARVFKIHTEDTWGPLASTKKGQEYQH
jgi:hypothetical protein